MRTSLGRPKGGPRASLTPLSKVRIARKRFAELVQLIVLNQFLIAHIDGG